MRTYHGYPYTVQRTDAARYLLLYDYGGVYADLDVGVKKGGFGFEPVRAAARGRVVLAPTSPMGYSNDLMAAPPRHPFLLQLIEVLRREDYSRALQLPTVMLSTGSLRLSVEAARWPEANDFYELSAVQYGTASEDATGGGGVEKAGGSGGGGSGTSDEGRTRAVVYHLRGSSWHSADTAALTAAWTRLAAADVGSGAGGGATVAAAAASALACAACCVAATRRRRRRRLRAAAAQQQDGGV